MAEEVSGRVLVRVPVGDPVSVRRLLRALGAALDGDAPALAPHAATSGSGRVSAPTRLTASHDDLDDHDDHDDLVLGDIDDADDPIVTAVSTSGSGGRARQVLLTRSALLASASAAHDRLGGPGRWLLALPAHHVAGLNVLVRSLVAGSDPVLLDLAEGFSPDRFTAACRDLTGPGHFPRYTALVPTQLVRLLDAGGAALAELTQLDTVLVGGAATLPTLAARARDAGVRVVTSYGMSETCGGCVYDGVALDGVTVRIRRPDPADFPGSGTGRIELAGPVLARGYLGDSGSADQSGFTVDDTGRRWFVTDDAGRWVPSATRVTLQVDGRLDGAVTTGGLTIPARAVEELLAELPGIAEAVVVGVPDEEWGQRLVAAVVATTGRSAPDLDTVRRHIGERLGTASAPRELIVLDALPTRGPGKPDRTALAALFEIRSGQGPSPGR